MVDFKELSAHTKRANEWAKRLLDDLGRGKPGVMQNAEIHVLSKALRDAWHQGKLGRKLQQEDR